MKPNFIVIFSSFAVIAAAFSLAVLEGATVAVRDSAAAQGDLIADAQ